MIIMKFVGKTEEDAVESAKKELGSGVVIMNVKRVKQKGLAALFRSTQVEVTAALEEEGDIPKPPRKESAPEPEKRVNEPSSNREMTVPVSENSQNIEKRLDSLQSLLERRFQQDESARQDAEPEQDENPPSAEEEEALSEEELERDRFVRLLYNTMLENEVNEKYASFFQERFCSLWK